jgi:spermidine synthase
MAQPWIIIDTVSVEEGELQLRRRGEGDFLITVGGLVLMNSRANRSELALGRMACEHLRNCASPRVLVGGLGMGYTLRAVLDVLPADARVVVAEVNPAVIKWCKGPLASLTDGAVDDPRVTVEIADVAHVIRRSKVGMEEEGFDAIVLDLYKGPHHRTHKRDDPLYGSRAIEYTRYALKTGGVFAIWGENYDAGFDQRLKEGGFAVKWERPGRGGLRHVVFLAKLQNRKAIDPQGERYGG